ncbi:hypothetical protein ACFL2B_00905 [Patescibacteria group bacterium]
MKIRVLLVEDGKQREREFDISRRNDYIDFLEIFIHLTNNNDCSAEIRKFADENEQANKLHESLIRSLLQKTEYDRMKNPHTPLYSSTTSFDKTDNDIASITKFTLRGV